MNGSSHVQHHAYRRVLGIRIVASLHDSFPSVTIFSSIHVTASSCLRWIPASNSLSTTLMITHGENDWRRRQLHELPNVEISSSSRMQILHSFHSSRAEKSFSIYHHTFIEKLSIAISDCKWKMVTQAQEFLTLNFLLRLYCTIASSYGAL